MQSDDMEFVAWMVRLGKEDRELYRQLRSEAWEIVAENHRSKSPEQRSAWSENAS